MRRRGWCFNNTNLATKIHVRLEAGKQLNYCRAPHAVLTVKSGATATATERRKGIQHYGETVQVTGLGRHGRTDG